MCRTRLVAALAATVLIAGCTEKMKPAVAQPAAGGPAAAAAAPAIDYAQWRAGTSAPVADPLYPRLGNPALDVLHYGLDLAWQPVTGTLTGTATLRIRPVSDAREIKLDFKPYRLDRVTVDGVAVTGAAVAAEKLTVPIAVTKDKPVTLVVAYHGAPSTTPMPSHRTDTEPLGLTVTKDHSLWTMQEPYGAYTWYPANDQPSDEALYDIAVTVPVGWSAVAAGTPAGHTGTTFRYRSTDPVATYLQTLAVSRYRTVTANGPHGIPLTYWYRPGTDDKLVPSLKKSPGFLSFLEKRFGPYPFPTGGIVVVDSASGMETQQMITMGGKIKKLDAAAFEEDLLHEYAHQWFGDSVTPTNWNDLWLNEGWAMYAQFLYSQSVHKFSDDELESFLRERDAELRAKLGPPAHPKAANFAESNVYVCPAAMLKQLHDALGDRKFFALATAWVQTQKNTQQTRASFTAFVNKQTGRDFTKLIDAWLDSRSTPK
ncbi:M1 family metallopeptidase [Krasilnikovia sp. MM14-A1259]|uniref:M1 family metallopeptidase n=1 Tax=Krasilnikovia sp. MM14-A1259 TaxID=3373539 RepID=UPI003801EA0A